MPALLALLKHAFLARNEGSRTTFERHARLAERRPQDTDIQAVAAYYAWTEGERDLALRFARRADEGKIVHFHALLVLTALYAEGSDHEVTYKYAKRLSTCERSDKTWNKVVGSATVLLRSRDAGNNARNNLDELSRSYDEWVTWAREFVIAYDHAKSDA